MTITTLSLSTLSVESLRLTLTAPSRATPLPNRGATPAVPAQPAIPGVRPAIPAVPAQPLQRGRDAVDERAALSLIDRIEEQIESSEAYQALRPFLEQAGLVEEREERVAPGASSRDDEAGETTDPDDGDVPPPIEPRFTTIEIEVDSVRYQRRVIRMEQPDPPRQSDPLAFDLNGNGLETTGLDRGVRFDIDGDGSVDRVSFISGGDAFLALDRNGNGRIDSGKELFGDQHGDAHGYAALDHYDDNGDGRIDGSDAVFNQLRLFSLDSEGSQRLETLGEHQISAIDLGYHQSQVALNRYDTITQQSSFEREDGSIGVTGDLLLGFRREA